MGGRASKAKGTTYENQLVKFLREAGFGAYRVPLSGAIGHGAAGKNLPDSLRRALSGDVGCEVTPGLYVPFEVKYRAEADGFKSLYNLMERDRFVTRVFDDARVYPEGDLGFLTGVAGETVTHAGGVLTDKFREWLVGSEVLALKAHRMPWLFVVPGRKA